MLTRTVRPGSRSQLVFANGAVKACSCVPVISEAGRRVSSQEALVPGVVERLGDDPGGPTLAEEHDRELGAGLAILDREVRERDRRADAVAVAARRHVADRAAAGEDRLVAVRIRVRDVDDQASRTLAGVVDSGRADDEPGDR